MKNILKDFVGSDELYIRHILSKIKEARDFIQDKIDIVVYHSPCDDGHSAASFFYNYNTEIELYGLHPKSNILIDSFTGKNVVFVDIAFSIEIISNIAKIAKKVVILDHHITNTPLKDLDLPNLKTVIIMDVPGICLAWIFLNGEKKIPKAFHYIALKDVWKHEKNMEAVYFTTAFNRPSNWKDYRQYFFNVVADHIIKEGTIIYEYQQSVLKVMMEKAQKTIWRGYRAVIVNVPFPWISDIGALLCETEPEKTIAIVWNKQPNGPYSVSLRSHNELGPNIEPFALEFNGGGHKHGAGCRTDRPPYEIFTDTGLFESL